MNRRTFLGKAGLIGTGLAALQPFPSVLGANQKIRLAIMGTNGRGTGASPASKMRKSPSSAIPTNAPSRKP